MPSPRRRNPAAAPPEPPPAPAEAETVPPPAKPKPKPKATAKPRPRRSPARRPRRKKAAAGRLARWRDRAVGLWRLLRALPPVVLTVLVLALLAVGAAGVNIAHWVIRKPTVLLAPISGALAKTPAQTWASYGELFQQYSTTAVSAELLAALAQTESAGDPAANTYWRFNPESPDFFGIFRPASSSVGLYQMTDPAFEEARRYCIRDHVVAEGARCAFDLSYKTRLLPSHAIELTAAWLDRSVGRAVGKRPASPRQMQDVAAIIHLCGGGPAAAFVRRGFRLAPGDRCGDHDPATYLAQVHALEKTFRRLATK